MISSTSSYFDGSAASLLAQLFQRMDTDGDAAVTESEFLSAMDGASSTSTAAADVFAGLDADGDGTLSQLEFTSAVERLDPANPIYSR